MIFRFFDYSSPFFKFNIIVLFVPISYKILLYYVFYYYYFDEVVIGYQDFIFFVPPVQLSIHASLLTFFICFVILFPFAVPMRDCFRKYSCMSSPFPIAILNATLFFCETR